MLQGHTGMKKKKGERKRGAENMYFITFYYNTYHIYRGEAFRRVIGVHRTSINFVCLIQQ